MSRKLYRIFDKLSTGVIILNEEKKIVFANDNIRKFFKGKKNPFLGEYLQCSNEILNDATCNSYQNCENCLIKKAFNLAIETGEEQVINNIRFSSKYYQVDIPCRVNHDPVNKVVIFEFLNISQEQERLNFFMKAFDSSRDIIFFKNQKLQYVYINKAGFDFFDKKDVFYKTDMELLPYEEAIDLAEGDQIALTNGKSHKVEYINNRIFRTSRELVNGGILGVAQDITEEHHAKELANIDTLTGLLNRKKYNEIINEIFIKRDLEYFLAIIDMDNLRKINNTYGHLKGDEYLKELGKILRSNPNGLFFRIGGDEFIGLIPESSKNIDEILKDLFSKISNANFQPKLSISCGVKRLDYNKTIIENFDDVDKELYLVKNSKKGWFKTE